AWPPSHPARVSGTGAGIGASWRRSKSRQRPASGPKSGKSRGKVGEKSGKGGGAREAPGGGRPLGGRVGLKAPATRRVRHTGAGVFGGNPSTGLLGAEFCARVRRAAAY